MPLHPRRWRLRSHSLERTRSVPSRHPVPARTLCPCVRRLRATAPPTLPVTPVTREHDRLPSGTWLTCRSDAVFDCGASSMNGILEMTKRMNQNVDERILNGMSAFAAIVQCGSFAGAGKVLNMSQSGVSRSIARLEARLGMRLLERTTRSISITEEGRRLHEQIGPLLTGIEEAMASVLEGQSTGAGPAARADASHVCTFPGRSTAPGVS